MSPSTTCASRRPKLVTPGSSGESPGSIGIGILHVRESYAPSRPQITGPSPMPAAVA